MSKYPAVLYVEDDFKSRTVMEVILTKRMELENLIILPDSSNFEEQLESLAFKPDIILLDIQMEPMNGFEMLKILRSHEEFYNLPIVALTASVMNDEVAQLKESSFNGVIPKPIDIMTFPDSLQRLLNGEGLWRITGR